MDMELMKMLLEPYRLKEAEVNIYLLNGKLITCRIEDLVFYYEYVAIYSYNTNLFIPYSSISHIGVDRLDYMEDAIL